ncbi:hypothetical protein Tco_1271291 [Tanacetum coccineum]
MILTRLFKNLKANMVDHPFDERYIFVPRKMPSFKAKQPKKPPPKRSRNIGKSKRAQLTTSSSSNSPPLNNRDLPNTKLSPRSYSKALPNRTNMSQDQREARGMFKNLARALHKFEKMLKKGLPPLTSSPNDPYVLTMDNWPSGPSKPSPPPRVTRPSPEFPHPPPGFEQLTTQPLFVNINNNVPHLHNNAPPLETIQHPPPNLGNQDFPNPLNILDFVYPNDMPHLHNMFCQCCSTIRHEIQML